MDDVATAARLASLLVLDVLLIVLVARLLGALARRLGQPAVIGEITGGILVGPTLLHGTAGATLFPREVRPALSGLATVGVCAFTFFVGRHLDRRLLSGQGRITAAVSLSTVVVPFCLGALLALKLLADAPPGTASRRPAAFVLFLATAMSITAFPVLARILVDRGLLDTPIGGLALACAAVDDVVGWSLLLVVAAVAGEGDPWRLVLVVPYLAVVLGAIRPLLARLVPLAEAGRAATAGVLAAVAALLVLSAGATDRMGLHSVFGAFLLGLVMPRGPAGTAWARALGRVEAVCGGLLLPVFFVVAGLSLDLSSLDGTGWGDLALVLLVAIGGKVGGAFVGARAVGVRRLHSAVLAILANTRGLTELIVLSVGLQLGVLDRQLFSVLVVMALVTTAMTGVALGVVYPQARARLDRAPRHDTSPTDGLGTPPSVLSSEEAS